MAAALYVTVKLEVVGVPESVSAEVVSCWVPRCEVMLIWYVRPPVQAVSSIGPRVPLTVAWALVKPTLPKLASGRMPKPEDGASTTHSAEDR